MNKLALVCTNKLHPSVPIAFHIARSDVRTYCGRDRHEWLVTGELDEGDALNDRALCALCVMAYRRELPR